MKNRLKSAKQTTSEEALTQSTQQTHKRDRRVLEQLHHEDEVESERPTFKMKESDSRKVKINKGPNWAKPDGKLKNMVI